MSYLHRSYPAPEDVLPNDKFISIVVPAYCRPFYLKKLLDTLEQTADFMYELIVHDDASPRELQDQIYHMRDRISLTMFNNGKNMGLNVSSNRICAAASSKYILFMNDDCFFEQKCLKDVVNVLSRPYIGWISLADDVGVLRDFEGVVNTNGTRWSLTNLMGGGSTIAFRKDVWKEVEGWYEGNTSGQSDNVFIFKMIRAGYWKGIIEGPIRTRVGNFVYPAPDSGHPDAYKPTFPFTNGNDCSFPKIFGMDDGLWVRLNHAHREACQYWVDGERTIPNRDTYDNRPNPKAGLNDIPYWGNYFLDIFGHKHSNNIHDIDWEITKRHNQIKWKDIIAEDFKL